MQSNKFCKKYFLHKYITALKCLIDIIDLLHDFSKSVWYGCGINVNKDQDCFVRNFFCMSV